MRALWQIRNGISLPLRTWQVDFRGTNFTLQELDDGNIALYADDNLVVKGKGKKGKIHELIGECTIKNLGTVDVTVVTFDTPILCINDEERSFKLTYQR